MVNKWRQVVPVGLLVGVMMVAGCAKEYDLERQDFERGTLGEELYEIWAKDTARSATRPEERMELLESQRDDFVDGVDRAVPPGQTGELDEFLVTFVPMIEEGYFPALTRRVPGFFDEARADEELMESLTDRPLYGPFDYLTPVERGGLLEAVMGYDDALMLVGHVGEVMVNHDGRDEWGEETMEVSPGYADLLRAVSMALDEPPEVETTDRLSRTLRDLLIAPDNRYRSGDRRDMYVALFNEAGGPAVRTEDGEVVAPFVDSTGDGMADVDEEGRFVLEGGQVLEIAPLSQEPIDHPELSRDVFGRAQRGPGQYVFEYVDISDTALPFILRMAGELAEGDALYHLARVGRDLLGPAEVGEDERGTYRSFSEEHPVVDLFDAIISGMSISELPEVMGLVERYLNRDVDTLAKLSYTVGDAAEVIAEDDRVDIDPDVTLFYDVLDVLREIAADEALWADVMDALRDPIMERAGESMATMIRYADLEMNPEPGGAYDACFQQCRGSHQIGSDARFECIRDCPMDGLLSVPTDFDAAKSSTEPSANRSRFQRLFHLLWDTAGAPYTITVQELEADLAIDPAALPELASMDGAAEAFLRSVGGELHLSEFLSIDDDDELGTLVNMLNAVTGGSFNDGTVVLALSEATEMMGARLDAEPTPDQITRLFNKETLALDEDEVYLEVNAPTGHDGFILANHHANELYAAEASGLIDVVHPLARAFAKHEREDLMAKLFSVVHDHYASRDDFYRDADGNFSPMSASNLVSAEEAMLEIFEDGRLFTALRELALSTQTLSDDDGVGIDERLRQLLYQWLRNDDGYSPRSQPFEIELPDGRVLDEVSRLEVILDRAVEMVDRVEDDEQAKEHLTKLTEEVFRVLLSADELPNGNYEFNEPGVVALVNHWLSYLGERAREMEARGEFEPWLTERVPDGLERVYHSRGFFAAIELLDALHATEEGRAVMADAPAYFGGDAERADQLSMALYALLVQMHDIEALMPAGRFAMQVLDPDRSTEIEPFSAMPTGSLVAVLMARMPEIDPHGYGMEVVRRGATTRESHDATWSVLGSLFLRYFSGDPAGEGSLSRPDLEEALIQFGDWLHDSERGLERFYEIIEIRGRLELESLPE